MYIFIMWTNQFDLKVNFCFHVVHVDNIKICRVLLRFAEPIIDGTNTANLHDDLIKIEGYLYLYFN